MASNFWRHSIWCLFFPCTSWLLIKLLRAVPRLAVDKQRGGLRSSRYTTVGPSLTSSFQSISTISKCSPCCLFCGEKKSGNGNLWLWNFLNSGERETCWAFKRDYNNKNRSSVLCLGKKTIYILLKTIKINRTEGPTFLMSGKVIKVWWIFTEWF